jgi:hypothetical protein
MREGEDSAVHPHPRPLPSAGEGNTFFGGVAGRMKVWKIYEFLEMKCQPIEEGIERWQTSRRKRGSSAF